MKKATKVGIARTLNSARVPKAGYIPSKMVRGYGSIKYGYTIKQLQNDFIVEYDNLANYVATYKRSEQDILAEKAEKNARWETWLENIYSILINKGYTATLQGDCVVVHNEKEIVQTEREGQ